MHKYLVDSVIFTVSHPAGLWTTSTIQSKTIVADVMSQLDGEYQWTWHNDGAVSASTKKVTTISWEGPGSSSTLEVNFLATGAVDPACGTGNAGFKSATA